MSASKNWPNCRQRECARCSCGRWPMTRCSWRSSTRRFFLSYRFRAYGRPRRSRHSRTNAARDQPALACFPHNGREEYVSTTCLEQAMDRPERFPHTLLDICQQDDIDILVGVVTNHRAHASVDALFLCEHDFSGTINSEAHPISVHLIPALLRMVEYLGSEECCRRLWREQDACFHLTKKPVQIGGGDVCAPIG